MRWLATLSLFAGIALSGCSDLEVNREVTIIVPASVPSIDAGTLVVVLYRYDPMLADGPAEVAFRSDLAFRHRAGVQTLRKLRVQGEGSGRDRFYLSVEGCDQSTTPAQAVLWDGLFLEIPSHVTMRVRETPFDCSYHFGLAR